MRQPLKSRYHDILQVFHSVTRTFFFIFQNQTTFKIKLSLRDIRIFISRISLWHHEEAFLKRMRFLRSLFERYYCSWQIMLTVIEKAYPRWPSKQENWILTLKVKAFSGVKFDLDFLLQLWIALFEDIVFWTCDLDLFKFVFYWHLVNWKKIFYYYDSVHCWIGFLRN